MVRTMLWAVLAAGAALSACVNRVDVENATAVNLTVKVELNAEVLKEGPLAPGEVWTELRGGRGTFKASATGLNYSASIEHPFSSSGDYLLRFEPQGAGLWKRVKTSP